MQTIRELITQHGGLEKLRELSSICIELDSCRCIYLEHHGTSPRGLPAVGITCQLYEDQRTWLSQIKMEMTDLGFLPFYLRTRHWNVYEVYRLNKNGRIRKTRRDVRAFIVRIAADWNEFLELHLPGRRIVTT